MQIKIKAKNLTLSNSQKSNIQAKVEKLGKLADRLKDESSEFRIEVRYEKSRKAEDAYICQLTIFAPGHVIRSETRSDTMINSVDECMEKIRGQIEKYKAKMHRTSKKNAKPKEVQVAVPTESFIIPDILRRKRFTDSAPLTEEDAIEKMELIGHGFFLFNNKDTGRFSVVYKRDDGYYGIIEPKLSTD